MRCRISGSFGAPEIPLLVMLFYLSHDDTPSRLHGRLVLELSLLVRRVSWETTSGGEFGWGGTSVKQ
jgi:hypothetical protein|eukprot:3993106-Lingulodinium_polyedra.AAC.1